MPEAHSRTQSRDKQKIETAPVPAAVAKQIIRAEIERHAEAGRPDVGGVIDQGEGIRWPIVGINYPGQPPLKMPAQGGDNGGPIFDGLATMLWLFKDQAIAQIEKEVDAVADDQSALSTSHRKKMLEEIEHDILANERDEERFIIQTAEAGTPVQRRRDAYPASVLQLEFKT